MCIMRPSSLPRGSVSTSADHKYAGSMEDDKVQRTQQGCLHSLGCVGAVFLVCS